VRRCDECAVEWNDIEEDTFGSFWEFAYTEDYAIPDSFLHDNMGQIDADTKTSSVGALSTPSVKEAVNPVYVARPRSLTKKQRKKKAASFESEDDSSGSAILDAFRNSWRIELSDTIIDNAKDRKNHIKDHAGILLHHARVYILADRYGLLNLATLSLRKLHEAVLELDPDNQQLNDFVTLLCFCYEEPRPEQLRRLVAHFTTCHIERLWESPTFQELVENHGSLSRDFMHFMLMRIS